MKYSILLFASYLFTFCSCSTYLFDTQQMQDPAGIYDEFWTYVDEHYMFFELKDIDWGEERVLAIGQIDENTTEAELFQICDQSLLKLRDTHSRLTGPDMTHTPYDFTAGYEVHFSLRGVLDHYIVDTLTRSGALYYGMLPNDIGYIYFRAMSQYGEFDQIVRDMKASGAKGLIIDVRGNGGGDSDPIPALLGNFTDQEILLGSYVEKAGPKHEDKSILLPINSEPNADGFVFDGPVAMIIDRAGYSATSYFAAMAKEIPSITVVGQITGGGAGGNMGYQLSNDWVVAVSVSDYIDVYGESIELGVSPDIEIENTKEEVERGQDRMLGKALDTLNRQN